MKSRRINCAQFCDTDYCPLLADIRTGDMYKFGTRTRTSQHTALRGHHLGFCSQNHNDCVSSGWNLTLILPIPHLSPVLVSQMDSSQRGL